MARKATRKTVQTEDPDWKKLEKIIAEIQQAVAPDAKVIHNDKIRGKSGSIRKLDVSIRSKIGINPVLIDIDAKHRGRAISRTDVAGFAEQVEDVGPCIGIMISDFTFGRGAEQVANKHNIILKTFTETTETDWKQLFGSEPLFFIVLGDWTIHEAWMPESSIGSVPSQTLIPLGAGTTRLFTNEAKHYPLNHGAPCALGDLCSDAYTKLPRPRPIGRFKTRIDYRNPLFYVPFRDGKFIAPPYILIDSSMHHKKYAITSQMAKGRSLKSFDTDIVEAMKIITSEINLNVLRNSQEGTLLTEEEWKENERVNLGEYRTDDNHLCSFEFVATPKEPK